VNNQSHPLTTLSLPLTHSLTHSLTQGAILHHVRKRFTRGLIYTHVGAILVAVNPFERLPIYGEDTIRQAQDLTHSFPHVYVSAAVAYAQVQASGKNQSVLISGESGAGKVSVCESVCVCVCESVCVSVCV
jgi:myosin heavy subunit